MVAGAGVTVQAGANGQLGRSLGHPLYASAISLAVSLIAVLPILGILRPAAPSLHGAATGPAWMWIGGFFGLAYVTSAVVFAPRLGATAFIIAVVAGQLLAALVLDSFGLLGFQVRPLGMLRLCGVALVLGGLTLVHLASHQP